MRLTLKEVDASLQWLSLHISEAYLTAYSSSRAFSSVCLPSVNSLTVSLISSLTFIPGGPLWVDGCPGCVKQTLPAPRWRPALADPRVATYAASLEGPVPLLLERLAAHRDGTARPPRRISEVPPLIHREWSGIIRAKALLDSGDDSEELAHSVHIVCAV